MCKAMNKKHCKSKEMLDLLQSSEVKTKVKKSLCLVYFVHAFLMGRDQGTNAMDFWFELAADPDTFCAYPWGRDSYDLTIQYLRKAATTSKKSSNLYGFPWAFMAWAFEAIPHIRKTFKEFDEEVSYPRLLRWLAAPNNAKVEAHELFDPPADEIVYPWLIPTESEKEMDFWKGFVPLEQNEEDPRIVRLVTDLAGVTAIKRDVVVDVGIGYGIGINPGVDVDAGVADARVGGSESVVGVDAAETVAVEEAAAGEETAAGPETAAGYRGGFSPLGGGGNFGTPFTVDRSDRLGAGTSKASCTSCSCETCIERTDKVMKMMVSYDERMDKMMEMILSFQETLNTMLSKRGVIPSSRLVSPYTPIREQRRRKQVSKALMSARKRAASARKEQQAAVIGDEQQATAVMDGQEAAGATEKQQPTTSTEKQHPI